MRNRVDINQNIVLIGIMGVGKTSIGRKLAKYISMPFFDSDQEVEKSAYSTISDIYELYGETAFRETERRVIKRLLENPQPHILSTGVGSFADDEIRQIIKSTSISIWIRADIEDIVPRVTARKHRPQLQKDENPETVIRELEKKYLPYYQQADIVVDCKNDNSIIADIMTSIENYLSGVYSNNR